MRWLLTCALAGIVSMLGFAARASHATSPVPVAFGVSWDGPGHDLQHVVDAYLGTPGVINVKTDYVGAHPGDLDPWFWVGKSFPAIMVAEIAGNANINELDWYIETGTKPVLNGSNHGIVFDGPATVGNATVVTFPSGTTKFGFFLDTHKTISTPTGAQEQLFWTNRFYNGVGPSFSGVALHPPYDGNVQALVFDVSMWRGPNTWLVCFEDCDSGLAVTPCCDGTDNDYNDLVFEVTALGATPTQTLSFGQLKARYR